MKLNSKEMVVLHNNIARAKGLPEITDGTVDEIADLIEIMQRPKPKPVPPVMTIRPCDYKRPEMDEPERVVLKWPTKRDIGMYLWQSFMDMMKCEKSLKFRFTPMIILYIIFV